MEYSALASLEYVDQSIADLSLYFIRGTHLAEPLHAVAEQEICTPSYQAGIAIIGASHTITFSSSNGSWREILACLPGPPVTDVPLVVQKRVKNRGGSGSTESGYDGEGIRYRFHSRMLPLSEKLYAMTRDKSVGADALLVSFPGRSAIPPFTGVAWIRSSTALAVDSVHAYPGEGKVVMARSLFAIRPDLLPSLEEMPFRFGAQHWY